MVGDSERRNVIGRVQAADGEQYAAAGGQQQEHEQEQATPEQSARAERAERREERARTTAHVGEAARASDTKVFAQFLQQGCGMRGESLEKN